jgi:hypothetical protein
MTRILLIAGGILAGVAFVVVYVHFYVRWAIRQFANGIIEPLRTARRRQEREARS